MAEILKSVLFGIVQGITEWLPISSTGHMILLNEFVTLDVTPQFWEMFKVVIQFGSILAVVLVFWNRLFPFDFKQKPVIKTGIISMWLKVIVGCIPAGLLVVFGLDEVCDALFQNYLTVAVMLIVVGVLFILIENNNKDKKAKITDISQLTYKTAFLIGIFQLIAAVFPMKVKLTRTRIYRQPSPSPNPSLSLYPKARLRQRYSPKR